MSPRKHRSFVNSRKRSNVKSIKSKALTLACLTATGLSLNGCAGVNVRIPDSLREECVSTVDVSGAQTIGDLGKAIIQGDGDLRVCEVKKAAVIAIAESQNRRWWQIFR